MNIFMQLEEDQFSPEFEFMEGDNCGHFCDHSINMNDGNHVTDAMISGNENSYFKDCCSSFNSGIGSPNIDLHPSFKSPDRPGNKSLYFES